MKIPSTVKIGAHVIEVGRHTRKESDDTGYYDRDLDRISIRRVDIHESRASEILLHEVIEAIKYKYGLILEHKDLMVLSEVLFQVMRDNELSFCKEE